MNNKVILMILDGWGHSPNPKVSAIDHANTPFIDSLYKKYSHATLRTDGLHVGLPEGQMGNSEVGHMNLGAGRIVYQDLVKVNLAVKNKTLHTETVLVNEEQLLRVLNNLLNNAFESIPEGRKALVSFGLRKEERQSICLVLLNN